MKSKILKVLKYLSIFFLIIITFNILLYLSCSFNSNLIKNNVISSYKILKKQGSRLVVSKSLDIMNDNNTDALIMNEAISIDAKNPYVSYMKMRKNYRKDITIKELEDMNYEGVVLNHSNKQKRNTISYSYKPIVELGNFINSKIYTSLNYGRYWHGYMVMYRPLLLIFNISQIRILLFLFFVGLFTYFTYLIYKAFGKNIAIIFGLSLLLSGYFSAAISLECAPIFLVMIISSIILLKRLDKIKDIYFFVFIVACISNYVDFLTVPLITLGIPLIIYFLKLMKENHTFSYYFRILNICTIVWFFGYAGTWIMKWVLYDMTISHKESMLYISIIQSFFRTQNSYKNFPRILSTFLFIIRFINKYLVYIPLATLILIYINKFKTSFKFNNKVYLFLIISLYPIIWWILLLKHSNVHYYFVYRHSLLFIIGILLSLNEILLKNQNKSF